MAVPSITAVNGSLIHLAAQLRAQTTPSAVLPSSILPVDSTTPLLPRMDASGFTQLVEKGLAIVSHAEDVARADQQAFASGAKDAPSLAQTMLAIQKSDITFQEMIGIRNELARGYETLMTMTV